MKPRLPLIVISIIITLLFSLIPLPAVNAQENKFQFEFVFNLGAPSSQVLLQDSEGFLWFGSAGGGLFRYDGYEPKIYQAGSGGLSNSYIYGLVEDPVDPNIFWIATKEGLNRFDKQTETFTYYQNNPDNPDSISHNAINDIIQDSHDPNILWIGTEFGLNLFDKNNETFKRYTPETVQLDTSPCHAIWRIIEDTEDSDILWLGSWGCGLERFDKKTGAITRYLHENDNPDSLGAIDNVISSIKQDLDNPDILWLGTLENGFEKFDKQSETFTHYPPVPLENDINTPSIVGLIYDDGEGQLWLGGYQAADGLYLFSKETQTFKHYQNEPDRPNTLPNDMIVNVFRDRSGIIWITDFAGNISKIDPYSQVFPLYQNQANNANSLSNSAVTSIFEDSQQNIWIGTQKGLNKLEPDTDAFSHYFSTSEEIDGINVSGSIYDIVEDSQGDLWVSFFLGPLFKFDKNGKLSGSYLDEGADSITQMVNDSLDPNILWAGTRGGGLARFDKKKETFTFFPNIPGATDFGPSQSFIYTIFHDRQEEVIWMGGWEGGGLNRFDKNTQRFEHFLNSPDDPTSISSSAIADIYQDTSGRLWIGTIGGGLDKFDKTSRTFIHYTQDQGVPAVVNGVLEDDAGYLWLSTDNGIVQFDPENEVTLQNYYQSDGLQGNQFTYGSAARSSDGRLWFGGTNGLNVFHPNNIPKNPYVPPIALTSFSQGGESLQLNQNPDGRKSITLDWKSNFFEFEYVALNFTNSENNHYAYMLEGLDSEWFNAGTRRFGRYTSLPPGEYMLHVKGSNNHGVWNDEGISIKINILPLFWKTWWFYSLCFLMILGVSFSIYQNKSSQLKKERAAAEAIRISEERLSLAIMGGELGLWDWDIHSGVTFINQRWAQILGYQIEDIEPSISTWESLLHPEDLRRVVDELNEHVSGITPIFRTEYRLKTRDGGWKWVQDIAKVVEHDIDGKPIRIAGVHIDITERKRMELNMLTSKKLAELGTLSAGIAHEINSPLQIITGISESLMGRLNKSGIDSDELIQEIDRINRNGWRIAKIVRSLLTFARSSAIETEENNLNEIIKDTMLLIEHQLRSWDNIEVETVLSDNLPLLSCDRNSITQIIINLITNARDAMPQGGKISIRSSYDSTENIFTLQVTDTGSGIPENIIERIFDPFYTTKPVGKGTGLGLSVVMGTVRTHGGNIQVESEENKGTTFTIKLPQKPPPSDENNIDTDYFPPEE